VLVVASGGGGIPVVKINNKYQGVDAVIDKDRAAALMGDLLQADMLVILTAVEKVALNFGKENEQLLDKMNLEEAKRYLAEGHFAAGSMGPKVEAVVDFISKNPTRSAIITHPDKLVESLNGQAGTTITFN
jgi:carbamate kinase